jgi:hypothetical protein
MGRSQLRQQAAFISGNPGAYHNNAFAPSYNPGFRPNFTVALISQQRGVKVNGQWKIPSTDDIIVCAFFNIKFNVAGSFGAINMLFEAFHFVHSL